MQVVDDGMPKLDGGDAAQRGVEVRLQVVFFPASSGVRHQLVKVQIDEDVGLRAHQSGGARAGRLKEDADRIGRDFYH